MNHRANLLPIAIAAALALTACGGGDDDSAPPVDTPSTEVDVATTAGAPDETLAAEAVEAPRETSDATGGDSEATDGCAPALTSEEIESFLGTAPEINGSGEQCQHVYAGDAVGTFQAYSGSKADEAIESLLAGYQDDETKSENGVLLDDGRGYVLDGSFSRSTVVRGDSGQVFVFTAPDNLEVADIQMALLSIAGLLLTR